MKTRKIAYVSLVLSLLLIFSGCAKQQNSSNNTLKKTDTASNTEPKKEASVTPDSKSVEAKKVIVNYLNALPGAKESNKFCTERHRGKDKEIFVRIDSIKLIKIEDDKGQNMRYTYLKNTGSRTNPFDAISFSVTYDIQYNKEDEIKATEHSGEKTKWFTLVKMTEDSPWLVDEVGY